MDLLLRGTPIILAPHNYSRSQHSGIIWGTPSTMQSQKDEQFYLGTLQRVQTGTHIC